jgi:hypothetical protein
MKLLYLPDGVSFIRVGFYGTAVLTLFVCYIMVRLYTAAVLISGYGSTQHLYSPDDVGYIRVWFYTAAVLT